MALKEDKLTQEVKVGQIWRGTAGFSKDYALTIKTVLDDSYIESKQRCGGCKTWTSDHIRENFELIGHEVKEELTTDWDFNDESIQTAIGIIVERKFKALTLDGAMRVCRDRLDEEWGSMSCMEIIEEYEDMTGCRIEDL